MSGRVKHKVVLITGGGRGQGAAEALDLAAEGATVWVLDVDEAGATQVGERIEAAGGKARARRLDVTDEAAWAEVVSEVLATDGRVDGLVNSAGIILRGGMAVPVADFRRNFDVNCVGSFLGMQAVAPTMQAQRSGSIVNVGSIAALNGYPTPAYGVSKWAVRGLSKAAALEYAPWRIRVNTIHPGIIDTPMISNPKLRQAMVDFTPAGRAGTPEDIVGIVRFLISDESEFITGADIAVDGGFSAGTETRMVAKMVGVLPEPEEALT